MKTSTLRIFIWVTVFAIAMGYLETAVVVYLREIYYPGGFAFPLQPINGKTAWVELFREFATLVMLAGIGCLAGRKNNERLAYFIYAFAIWDIFYYVFLKIALDWPASLLTWDILFLIPLSWVGPVVAPIINSLSMILLAVLIIIATDKYDNPVLKTWDWFWLIAGSVVVIVSYTEAYVRFMLQSFRFHELFNPALKNDLLMKATQFTPESFSWYLFTAGQLLIFLGIFCFWRRYYRKG